MALEVEPELGRGSEVPGEPQSRVCTYRPLAAHNVVHAGGIHADILGQPVGRYLKRLKELELQDPARVHRRVNSLSFASHGLSSSSSGSQLSQRCRHRRLRMKNTRGTVG